MITNDEYDKLKAIRRKLSLKDRQLVRAFLVEVDIAVIDCSSSQPPSRSAGCSGVRACTAYRTC